MYKITTYQSSDRMCDLICENYHMLLVLSRFNIPLGFGDKTIEDVCNDNKVDVNTFLAVINLLVNKESSKSGHNSISIPALLLYLKNSHTYFLEFRLPSIRNKLLKVVDADNPLSALIISYFDEYEAEVRSHMTYEDKIVFPYVDNLIAGMPLSSYNIETYRRVHDEIEVKLSELKNIIIKYYSLQGSNELNSVLFDIFVCSQDLASHNYIENELFVPEIKLIESKKTSKK